MHLRVALAIRNCGFAKMVVPQNWSGIGMADLPPIDETGYIASPRSQAWL
jgi:hypothetical protein